MAKDHHSNMWHNPANEIDLEEFAILILKKVFEEIDDNTIGVVINSTLSEAILSNKDVDGRLSLKTIKEKYIGNQNDKSNSDDSS